MGLFSKDAPKAPDPVAVANAQAAANTQTAQEQARLAMTGQSTPLGTLQYVADPNSPSGYRAITEYSPEQQALLEQFEGLTGQFGDVAGQQFGLYGDQLGRVGETISQPFDLNAARASEISDIQKGFLDPQWNQRAQELQASLLNRGIRPGSPAYENEMRMFNEQRSKAYDQMFLDAFQVANSAALTERNLPLADLGVISGISMPQQPGGPQFVNTPAPGVAPTDVIGPTYQSYQAELNSYNQGMGGLFGLGSSLLGGWAQAGFPIPSDRRLKTEIKRIGDDPRGWGVYLFRYITEGLKDLGQQIGFMADEVEKTRPEAVFTDKATGFKLVDYDRLALA